MRRLTLAIACSLLSISAISFPSAADTRAHQEETARKAESALLVTGTIDITSAGDVTGYAIDNPEKLSKPVVEMIQRSAPQWKFEPIALPNDAIGRTKMYLLFVAKKQDGNKLQIELRSKTFDTPDPSKPRVSFDAKRLRFPKYPYDELGDGAVYGTVFLVVRYNRKGEVLDVDAEQVNLSVAGSEDQMTRWRNALAKSSINAAKSWRLNVPASAIAENQSFGVSRIPVSFTGSARLPGYGKWQAYIPGPRKIIPWTANTPIADSAPDALQPGEIYQAENGRRLLTPADGN